MQFLRWQKINFIVWLHIPNSHSLQEQAEDCSEQRTCLGGEPSAMSNGTSTRSKCSRRASETGTCTTLPSGTMPSPSTGDRGVDLWISSLRDSRASRSAWQAKDSPRTIPETDGLPLSESFAKYDPDSHCWRTFQRSLLTNMLEPFSENWPRAAISSDMTVFQRRPSAPITRGTGGGLLPTPKVARGTYQRNTNGRKYYTLMGMAQHNKFPTPRSRDWKGQSQRGQHAPMDALPNALNVTGGQLNPNWVEWLMGWPIGWTDLEPLETDRFQQWLEKHGTDYQENS